MLRIHPFAAIRPCPNHVSRVASVPYDVVSTDEARALAADNPASFLHVVRPEIDLPPETDPYADAVYETAGANLQRLLNEKRLLQDDAPHIFLYRQVMDHRQQIGVVCCCHVDDYEHDVIKKHEKTRQDKEDDRTRHVRTLNANTGPVFLTYRNVTAIDELVDRDMNARPTYHFNAPDGVTHTVWTVPDAQAYVDAFAQVSCAYVADGHHRSASAARAGAERRSRNPGHTGEEEYNYFLSVLFPAHQLSILPYNRVLKDLNGHEPDAILEQLRSVGTVSPSSDPAPDRPGVFCMFLDGAWYRIELDPAGIDPNDPIGSLDVDLLQRRVLEPIFGIGDPRTDPRIGFVGGIRGTEALEEEVRAGRAAAALSMYATSIDQLMSVADAGLVMPPKSTWFEPKLRSGLFVHALD